MKTNKYIFALAPLAFLLSLSPAAGAALCDVKVAEEFELVDLPIRVTYRDGREQLFVPVVHTDNDYRNAAYEQLRNPYYSKEVLAAAKEKILNDSIEVIEMYEALKHFLLGQFKKDEKPNYIAIEVGGGDLKKWQEFGKDVLGSAWSVTTRTQTALADWDQLTLLISEPAIYVHTRYPSFFKDTELKAFDPLNPPAAQTASAATDEDSTGSTESRGSAREALNEKTQQLFNEFSRNRGTNRKFRRLVYSFNPNSRQYRGRSASEVARLVSNGFWSRSRSDIRQWVRLRMAANESPRSRSRRTVRRQRRAKPASHAAPQSGIDLLATHLASYPGKGLLLVDRSYIHPLMDSVEKLCQQDIHAERR